MNEQHQQPAAADIDERAARIAAAVTGYHITPTTRMIRTALEGIKPLPGTIMYTAWTAYQAAIMAQEAKD